MCESDLEKWMDFQKEGLKFECGERGITLVLAPWVLASELLAREAANNSEALANVIEKLLVESLVLLASRFEVRSKQALDAAIAVLPSAQCYLLIDGDRTDEPVRHDMQLFRGRGVRWARGHFQTAYGGLLLHSLLGDRHLLLQDTS